MIVTAETYHVPVLLPESIDGLAIKPDGVYVDATFGGGGHSREILRNLNSNGKLIGFDRDSDAEANAPQDSRFTFVHNNFRFILRCHKKINLLIFKSYNITINFYIAKFFFIFNLLRKVERAKSNFFPRRFFCIVQFLQAA